MKQSSDLSNTLNDYLERVLEKNHSINLTSIDDREKAMVLMLEDSLTALEELENAPSGRYGDLGTGGGFPGVPLGLSTERETWLIDSRAKKIDAIQAIVHEMELDHPFVYYTDRIETLALEQPNSFAVVTARALTSLPSLLELASPLLEQGGEIISFQAMVDEDVLNRASQVADIVGLELVSRRSFQLSDGETNRTLLTYRKVAEPHISLPRRIGVAQKKPLA